MPLFCSSAFYYLTAALCYLAFSLSCVVVTVISRMLHGRCQH
uniref:Uncharacterized protein n=1 Tax=Rhizophora mucronata TaxID=61149 RepID=A0A2P2Q674_RHIMU